MASSSHSSQSYDVFVSFRGEDTRNNFTCFLLEALRRKGIDAFKDDKDIKKGESIAPELLQAIQGSCVFVVIFSKNYASSTWCLRELVHICNNIQTFQRHVLPIFYDVDPSEVRKQKGYYEKAFAEHEERFRKDKEKMEEVLRWREALTQVANFSGWDIRNKQQYAEIEEIVEKITNILGHKFSSLPSDGLVGMESRVEELTKLLCMESVNNVRVVGISGMGGIGKTTLGRALYEIISHQYDLHCFIDDVSKIYRDSSTLGLQKQILSQSLNEKNLEICNVPEGTYLLWTRLRHARALIVFDNVDQVEQLRIFTGNRDTLLSECLGGGSRIIIMSRDEHILRTHGVDDVYQVQLLNYSDAIKLFCRNAFKSNYIMSDYKELTYDILSHAQGHPLAIEILGSSLFSRDVIQWRSALVRLREKKSKNIMDVLRISFDQLEDIDKEIFLDIACFFHFYPKQYVEKILYFRGFHPQYGLQVLLDKSLITMKNGPIEMHGLLRDLGKCIVREKSPKEPRKWSRLWDYKDFHKVMLDNKFALFKAAENLEAIVIRNRHNFPQTTMKIDALSKMNYLKLLIFEDVKFSGRLDNLSNELRYLSWNKYPFECLPPSFEPDKIFELLLRDSNIKQLWEGTKSLHNLRHLNLSDSKIFVEMPNFEEALNLECLDFQGCIQLRKIDSSIGLLKKLTVLDMADCENLISLPNSILDLNSLEYLNLSCCSKLYNIQLLDEPRDAEHLKDIYIGEAPIHSQSTSSHFIEHKKSISCSLSSSPVFRCICSLDLSFCNLVQIPDAIGNLCCLQSLNLSGNNFTTLPNLKELFKLFHLNLQHCKQLKYLPKLPSRIDFWSPTYIIAAAAGLYIFNCPELELVEREHCNSIGFSWMMKIVQALHQYKCIDYPMMQYTRISSIIPGNEMQRWFNNQLVGSLVSIDVSPVMHDNDWIGVACCVVFVVHHEKGLAMNPSKPKGRLQFLGDIPLDLYGDPELVSDESDHMWQFFVNRRQFIRDCLFQGTPDLARVKWELKIRDEPGFHAEVKKYGYRWVYKQDLELPNLTMMHSGNSLTQKRKCLAIEGNKVRNQGKRSKGRMSTKQREDGTNSSMENTMKLLQNQFANLGL